MCRSINSSKGEIDYKLLHYSRRFKRFCLQLETVENCERIGRPSSGNRSQSTVALERSWCRPQTEYVLQSRLDEKLSLQVSKTFLSAQYFFKLF